jgi:hypothetical protein
MKLFTPDSNRLAAIAFSILASVGFQSSALAGTFPYNEPFAISDFGTARDLADAASKETNPDYAQNDANMAQSDADDAQRLANEEQAQADNVAAGHDTDPYPGFSQASADNMQAWADAAQAQADNAQASADKLSNPAANSSYGPDFDAIESLGSPDDFSGGGDGGNGADSGIDNGDGLKSVVDSFRDMS